MQLLSTYQSLPNSLYAEVHPLRFKDPQLLLYNDDVSKMLGIDHSHKSKDELVNMLLGYQLPRQHNLIAQAYAGHQFGHFTTLGDGRAMLLGEVDTGDGRLVDIHLKGSGRTPYSRSGDGNATLSAMLREYLISDAMHALGIPTSRSLAVVDTGEVVYRKRPEHGAVLVRVAASHIRVGTFQYARTVNDGAVLKALLDYTIERHYPECLHVANPASAFLEAVMRKQAYLITEWMRVGFIHGVMNTDNMMVSGETLDYGPCAFMNRYHEQTVFSSIDEQGRYAFGNQRLICQWNLARLAESLLPLLSSDQQQALTIAETILQNFDAVFDQFWLNMMGDKLGLGDVSSSDKELVDSLLQIMQRDKLDYTNTFYQLTYDLVSIDEEKQPGISAWISQWRQRLDESHIDIVQAQQHMQRYNPVVIPRNHLVEAGLTAAENGDIQSFTALARVLRKPYALFDGLESYQVVPPTFDDDYQTFCGT